MTRDQQALVQEHIGYARYIAHTFIRRFKWLVNHQEDIRQEAMVGLCEAAVEFDPSRGVKFVTFAKPRVEWLIKRCVEAKLSPFGQGASWRSVPRASEIDAAPFQVVTQTPEKLAMLHELDRGLKSRVGKMNAITRDIYRERLHVDRALSGKSMTCGHEPHPEGFPALGKKYGVSKQRAKQIEAAAEEKIRAWGRRIEEEAA